MTKREVCVKLQQLRYLLAIADNGLSVTAAANRLYTSQPGISKQLGLLEEELGMPLFFRTGRKLSGVTTFGVEVIAHARVIAREADAIHAMARGSIGEKRAAASVR